MLPSVVEFSPSSNKCLCIAIFYRFHKYGVGIMVISNHDVLVATAGRIRESPCEISVSYCLSWRGSKAINHTMGLFWRVWLGWEHVRIGNLCLLVVL